VARMGFQQRAFPRRGRPARTVGKLLLILCEGDETEPNYLDDIRVARRLPAGRIRIVPSSKAGCTDPRGLVGCAKEQRSEFQKEVGTLEPIETWCVFDRDAQPLDRGGQAGAGVAVGAMNGGASGAATRACCSPAARPRRSRPVPPARRRREARGPRPTSVPAFSTFLSVAAASVRAFSSVSSTVR